jgi:hypothetical protein
VALSTFLQLDSRVRSERSANFVLQNAAKRAPLLTSAMTSAGSLSNVADEKLLVRQALA